MIRSTLPYITNNTEDFKTQPMTKPAGFREYDARWWFGLPTNEKAPELNLYEVQALGEGLGTLMHEQGINPNIAVGRDFRHYSLGQKMALISGLMNTGLNIHNIGLALSPMVHGLFCAIPFRLRGRRQNDN